MKLFSHNILSTFIAAVLLCAISANVSAQQVMTRGQVLKTMYKADSYHAQGKDSLAIAVLDSMANLVPRLSVIYDREGRIYEAMYDKSKDITALNAAVLMYRKYMSLEMNEKKTAEISSKLRMLEDKLQVAHFEDMEEEVAREEERTSKVLPTIIDDNQATQLASESITIPAAPAKQASDNAVSEVAMVATPTVIAKPEPAVTVANTPAPVQNNVATASASAPQTFSYLSFYEIEVPTQPKMQHDKDASAITTADLEGHWVSSIANSDGRERWIFDITPFDQNCAVALHPEAGILNEPQNNRHFYDKVVNFMKDNDLLSNMKLSIPCDQVMGTVTDKQMSFTLESEKTYKPNSSIYSWGHTLLDNVSTMLPFGQILYKIGNSMLDSREEKDVETTYNIESRFTLTKVADGVLRVHFNSREKKSNKFGTKLVKNDMQSFLLFRTTIDYVHFTPIDTDELEDDHTELFARISKDAQKDPSKVFALANMYFYGVGTEADESLAIKLMNQCATHADGAKAYAWLSKFYFNEAYENQDLSSISRKKYIKASNYNMNKLRNMKASEWYAIKGDMLENESGAEADSAFFYYQQGAMKGDAYALYKLGTCYVNANHTTRDFAKGRNYLTQAANKGNAEAYLALARMDKAGVGGLQNLESYLGNLSKAIDLGSVEAIHELSDAYMQGIGVMRDFHQATMIRNHWYRAQQNGWIEPIINAGYSL